MKKVSKNLTDLWNDITLFLKVTNEKKNIEETKNLCLKLLLTELTTSQSIEVFEAVKLEFENAIFERKQNAQTELNVTTKFLNN